MATPNNQMPIPGSYGLPIIGLVFDTLDFMVLSGWEKFFLRRRRKYRSNVFKTHMFQKTIVALDHSSISPLFLSQHLVQDYGFGWAVPPRPLVGHVVPSIFESGNAHDRPKALYMQLLRKRTATLLPEFNTVAREFIERWLSLGTFSWRDELEDFAASFLFQWVLGERPDPKDVRTLYGGIFTQMFVAINKHLPWSNYCRSLVIYDRLLQFVRRAEKFPEIMELARDQGLTDEDHVAKQILFLLGMNSFLGMQGLLKALVGELSLREELCDTLRKELKTAFAPSNLPADIKSLAALPTLDKTLREVLRLHPPVFFIFGRATRDIVIASDTGSFAMSKGELLMGVIPIAHQDGSKFVEPERFNPHRFDDPAASAHLIWPRGLHDAEVTSQDRTCPGKDIAIVLAKLFCVLLLSQADWKLKDSRPQWGRRWFHLNVCAPKGSIDVERFARRN